MPAVIESTLYTAPPPGGSLVAGSTQQNSREDLQLGYHVVLNSVHEATTYSWSLSFASDSPGDTTTGSFGGTGSTSALLAPEGSTSRTAKFNVDFEGTYLIRLVVDAGLATEDTQFIRLRVLTMFGALKLIAAGERRDENGVIPVDATPEGWANDQNANFQRLALLIRRQADSGRVLYVDSNRGRSRTYDQNDYDNIMEIPGPESARKAQTGMRLRAMAHGDFSSINEAISYADAAAGRGEPAPSASDPYFIMIKGGLYTEDLALSPHVHLIGEREMTTSEGKAAIGGGLATVGVTVRTLNSGGTGTHRFNPEQSYSAAQVILADMQLEMAQSGTQPVLDVQGGAVVLHRCLVRQKGNTATQGDAIRCVISNAAYKAQVFAYDCEMSSDATTADRRVIRFDAIDSSLYLERCKVEGRNPIEVNESLYEVCEFQGHEVSLTGQTTGYVGYGSFQLFKGGSYSGNSAPAIQVAPFGANAGAGAGSKAGDVAVEVRDVALAGVIEFETAAAAGTTSLKEAANTLPSASGTHIELPDAPGDLPNTLVTDLLSSTVQYVPDHADPLGGVGAAATVGVANRIGAGNVQEAIDTLLISLFPETGSPFRSLTSAYNGLVTLDPVVVGAGLGRNIDATSGAVQIQGATYPVATDNQRKDGGLQVEGMVDIGGFIGGGVSDLVVDVGHSEIGLIPDFTGAGPFIGLGRARWANGVTTGDRGFGSASIVAGISNSPSAPSSNAPYHLHLRTSNLRSSGTSKAGNIYAVAGGIYDAASAHDPGDAHLMAGSSANGAGSPGDLFLAPGVAGSAGGDVFFVGPSSTTRAALTSTNPYAGGQAGVLYIGTPAGVEAFTFTGAENLAAATTLLNATARNFIASNDGTRLILSSSYGPSGDIRVVGDSVAGALDTALGTLDSFTAGVYGDKVAVDVPSNGRLRVAGAIEAQNIVVSSPLATVTASRSITPTDLEDIYSCQLTLTVDIDISLDAALPTGRKLSFKDENGTASAGNQVINITDAGGATFDGSATLSLDTAYESAVIYKNAAGNWSIL